MRNDLTSDEISAVTHAHMDLVAGDEAFNGDSPLDRRAWRELAVAFEDTRKELEEAFPWLLDYITHKEDE